MEFQKLKVKVDRPIGYKDDFDNVYPLNYGYTPGKIGGDGEEQDVYIRTAINRDGIYSSRSIKLTVCLDIFARFASSD